MIVTHNGLDVNLDISDDGLTLRVKCQEHPKICINAHFSSIIVKDISLMSIKAGQQVVLSLDPKDSYGNPAGLDGAPVWNLVGEGLGSLAVAQDGLTTVFTSSGLIGSATVEVAADVDLSNGVRNLGGSVVIDIEAGEAVDLGVRAESVVVVAAPISVAEAAAIVEASVASPDVVIVDVLPVEGEVYVAPVAVEEPVAAVDTATETTAVEEPVVTEAAADGVAVDTSAPVVEDPTVATETAAVVDTAGVVEEQPIV